jgi:hypothetical protein
MHDLGARIEAYGVNMTEHSVIDWGVALLFGVWIVATIVNNGQTNHFPSFMHRILNNSIVSWLVPVWTFFAPNPGTRSYHLLYRDLAASGEIGDWHQVQMERRSQLVCALWNPAKTVHKALMDLVNELALIIQATPQDKKQSIQLSIPYLTVASHVSAIPRMANPLATQFLLLQSTPEEDQVYYLSGFHQL